VLSCRVCSSCFSLPELCSRGAALLLLLLLPLPPPDATGAVGCWVSTGASAAGGLQCAPTLSALPWLPEDGTFRLELHTS
jgi:hypothetical protein